MGAASRNGFSKDRLKRIDRFLDERYIATGRLPCAQLVIAREGERGIGLFLILEGQCKVTIGGKTKARLGPGDFFGEVALLDGGPRTATVTAVSPVRLVGITGWVFRGLLMEHPTIALKTLEAVAGRLRSVSKEPV